MNRAILMLFVTVTASLVAESSAFAQACPTDGVRVGRLCVDKYEASAWDLQNVTDRAVRGPLIATIQDGTVTQSDLETAGATILGGPFGFGFVPYTCSNNGNDCGEIFAVSLAGVYPAGGNIWFQAQQFCGNSGKRLLTNGEWQMAAAGTADPGSNNGFTNQKCNTFGWFTRLAGTAGATPGGANSCISTWGVEEMVGNLEEWVAES